MKQMVDTVNEIDVIDLAHALLHRWRSLQQRALRDDPRALAQMEMRVLGYFARNPGATQSDLAVHSGRDKAQLARLVKTLRDRGLLLATADPDDGRSLRLSPSADGAALQAASRRDGAMLRAAAVAGFSAAEREQLAALLLRVNSNLDTAASRISRVDDIDP